MLPERILQTLYDVAGRRFHARSAVQAGRQDQEAGVLHLQNVYSLKALDSGKVGGPGREICWHGSNVGAFPTLDEDPTRHHSRLPPRSKEVALPCGFRQQLLKPLPLVAGRRLQPESMRRAHLLLLQEGRERPDVVVQESDSLRASATVAAQLARGLQSVPREPTPVEQGQVHESDPEGS
jgi:hypothetical protein